MISFLKLPPWKVFILLIIPIYLGFINSIFSMVIGASIYFLWLFIMAISTRYLNPEEGKFSIASYILRLTLCFLYIIVISNSYKYTIPAWLIPIHLIAMILMATCLATCAKSIVNAETQKDNTFYDSLGTFLLIWFYPIGIWFVQHRLNALYTANKNT